MQTRRLIQTAVAAFIIVQAAIPAVSAEQAYTPRIPGGFSAIAVLHVDYGPGPQKIRVEWGHTVSKNGEDGEYVEPACLSGMRVVGDKFYFIDDVAHKIKLYRSSDVFVWESDSLPNLHYYAVAPDGRVYAAWGACVDRLSCISSNGKLLWTVNYGDMLSIAKLKELGLDESYGAFGWLDWTSYGLTVTLDGLDKDGSTASICILLDTNGGLVGSLPGAIVGSDGTVFTHQSSDSHNKVGSLHIQARDRKGAITRTVNPHLAVHTGVNAAGMPSLSRVRPDVAGGFAIQGFSHLTDRIRTAHGRSAQMEEVLWRLDGEGRIKEEWRFPTSDFAARYPGLVVGAHGNVYHLKFGDVGINVVKYSKSAK